MHDEHQRAGDDWDVSAADVALSLTWVHPALEGLWGQVQTGLESLSEDQVAPEALALLEDRVRSLMGVLDLLGMPAAVLLLRHVLRALRGVREGHLQLGRDLIEALMLALYRLRLYAEMHRQGRDVPVLALFAPYHKLGLAQGQAGSTALRFLEYVAIEAAASSTCTVSVQQAQQAARQLRPALERALVAWLKGHPQAHRGIAQVFEQLLTKACVREEVLLWRSAALLASVLNDERLRQAHTVKALLGKFNRYLRARAQIPEDQLHAPERLPLVELTHETLQILSSSVSRQPSVREFLTALAWPTQAPGQVELDAAESALMVAEPEVMIHAAEQLREALAPIKDRFDLALRTGDAMAMTELAPELEQITATMLMLDMRDLSERLAQQVEVLKRAAACGAPLSENEQEGLVGVLMRLDIELDRIRLGLGQQKDERVALPLLTEATVAVARQGLDDVLLAKELLLSIWRHEDDIARLDHVRQLLARVRGNFDMLAMPAWSGMVGGLLDFVALMTEGKQADEHEQQLVADVFASLEYGLENLRDYHRVPGQVLNYGLDALRQLNGEHTQQLVRTQTEEEAGAEHPLSLQALEPAAAAEPPVQSETVLPSVAEEAFSPGEEPAVQRAPLEVIIPPKTAPSPVEQAPAVEPLPQLLPPDADEEVVAIFVEEAREIHDVLVETIARLRSQPNDRDTLADLRRAFHTLKGSGRIIGAKLAGEFGWAFENMLNRVLDGSIVLSPAMFDLLDHTPGQLSLLLDGLEGRPGLSITRLEKLCAIAHAFAEGQTPDVDAMLAGVELVPDLADASAANASLTAEVAAEGSSPEMDAEAAAEDHANPSAPIPLIDSALYVIFRSEAEGYLEALRHAADKAEVEGQLHPDNELIRVTHSLLGSARTAQANRIVTLAGHLEHAMRLAHDTQQALDAGWIGLIRDVVSTIKVLLDELGGLDVDAPDPALLEMVLQDRIHQLQERASVAAEAAVHETASEAPAPVEVAEVGESSEAVEAVEEPEASPVASTGISEQVFDIPADQDQVLLDIFREEAEELIEQMDEDLAVWRREPDEKRHQRSLQRHLHTFKGGARMAGMRHMGDLAHAIENIFMDLEAGRYTTSPELLGFIQQVFDHLYTMVRLLQAGQPIPAASGLIERLESIRQHDGRMPVMVEMEGTVAAPAAEVKTTEAAEPTPPIASQPAKAEATPDSGREAVAQGATVAAASGEMLRVRANLLDQLVSFAGESAILHARMVQLMTAYARQMRELEQTVARLRGQLRRMEIENEAQMLWRFQHETGRSAEEFDPLEFDRYSLIQELGRGVMESLEDIESIQDALEEGLRDVDMLLTHQGRLGRSLQDGLMSARLVRFNNVAPRLKRLVRQVSRELGKRAELDVRGGDVELEGGLLNTLVPAFEHMLRNALAHGIETPSQREQAGKPIDGRIVLQLESSSGHLEITLADDGAGVNIDALRRKAKMLGLLDEQAAKDDQAAMQLMFRSGMSTAETVSQVAGRGVGMDVVAEALRQVGGDVQVHSVRGHGTTFTLQIPLTQAISQGVVVMAGGETFAVSYSGVEAILRAPRKEIQAQLADDEPKFEINGMHYPLVDLARLLGLPSHHASDAGMVPLLLLHLGERRMVVYFDELIGSQPLFIKSVGPFLARVPALAGASITGEGKIILVLDVAELFRLAGRKAVVEARVEKLASIEGAQPLRPSRPQVLVVDDSITIRKVSARILERYGVDVATAKDGVDALAWLHDHRPSVVLSDIEMPRMDGFELLSAIRNDDRLGALPVVMITSRTGSKHRDKATALGVDAYLGKPYTEADLIMTLSRWIPDIQAQGSVGRGARA